MYSRLPFILLLMECVLLSAPDARAAGSQAEVNGVKAQLQSRQGKAGIAVTALGRYEVRVDVDPADEREPLSVRAELPETGPRTWPVEDVQVFDAKGVPVAVRHDGVEWHKLEFRVPPTGAAYFIRAADRPDRKSGLSLPSEGERTATDPRTGLTATLCRWLGGHRAALSIRFDDSHPSHLLTVIPILRQYGFRATFMINPGRSEYQERKGDWEACARLGDQEFGNHTMHHRGATGDEEMDREIGEASEYIASLFPHRSKVQALNLGGSTFWVTTKPLRYYLEKYHSFNVTGSLGMDDVYGDRAAALRQNLMRHMERGLWCRAHFHSIGQGLSASEEHFRAALEEVKTHASDLWIAGLADVYKYQEERKAAKLSVTSANSGQAVVQLSCGTDPELYDQPLTIEVALPPSWLNGEVKVTKTGGSSGGAIKFTRASEGRAIRFDVVPVNATYIVKKKP